MPAHKSHGRTYVEPERHDELSEGVPEAKRAADSGAQQREAGRFVAGTAEARDSAARGGRRRKGTTSLSHHIGSPALTRESTRRALTLRRALAGEIASSVGGGRCGIAASLLIKFAAQKTAAAEEAFARGDFEAHRKLTESARMDVLYAREHAAKEAAARAASGPPVDPLAAWRLPPTEDA